MEIASWQTRRRNYILENSKAKVQLTQTDKQPLAVTKLQKEIPDPLGIFGPVKVKQEFTENPKEDPSQYWSHLTQVVSSKFASSSQFKIATNTQEVPDSRTVSPTYSRLEVLQASKKPKDEFSYVSHQEFLAHIEMLGREMEQAWSLNDRVKTLKLVIQTVKMMRDVVNTSHYPAVFFSAMKMLDNFEHLVYNRLFSIAFSGAASEEFLPNQVNEEAKDTANNWFLKISCIRELQPRIFVEIALLKCYRFKWIDKYPEVMTKLVHQIRGIGNPIMSCYAGMYLALQTVKLNLKSKDHLDLLLQDLCEFVSLVSQEQYEICKPALQWLFYCVSYNSQPELIVEIVDKLRPSIERKPILLGLIIEEFPSHQVTSHINFFMEIFNSVQNANDIMKVAISLTKAVYNSSMSKSILKVLNLVWDKINENSQSQLELYVEAVEIFIQIMLKHDYLSQANSVIKDFISNLKSKKSQVLESLEKIMRTLLLYSKNFSTLLSIEDFLSILDEFPLKKKTELCHKIVEHYARDEIKMEVSNPFMIHTLFTVMRIVHDSIDFRESSPEYIKRISQLICRFLKNLNFGKNLEQHLNVLSEARASFSSMEMVTETLIQASLEICMRAHQFVKGKHNLKTLAFLKACISYAHITIPSLEDLPTQFKLFVLSSQVALVNGLIGEAEALVKAAVSLIPELEKTIHEIEPSIHSLVSQMVFLPENPASTSGFLLPANGLFNSIRDLHKNQTPLKVRVLISLMRYLNTQTQLRLPATIFRVDSNDKLMSGNEQFSKDLSELLSVVVEELMEILSQIYEAKDLSQENLELIVSIYIALEDVYDREESSQLDALLTRMAQFCKQKKPEAYIVKYLN